MDGTDNFSETERENEPAADETTSRVDWDAARQRFVGLRPDEAWKVHGNYQRSNESKENLATSRTELEILNRIEDLDFLSKLKKESKGGSFSLTQISDTFFEHMPRLDADRNGFVSDQELLDQLKRDDLSFQERAVTRFVWQHRDLLPSMSNDVSFLSSERKAGTTLKDVEEYSKEMLDFRLLTYVSDFFTNGGRKRFDSLFSRLDPNKNGVIERKEIEQALRFNFDKRVLHVMMNQFDRLSSMTPVAGFFETEGISKGDLRATEELVHSDETMNKRMDGLNASLDSDFHNYAERLHTIVKDNFYKIDGDGDNRVSPFELSVARKDVGRSLEERVTAAFLAHMSSLKFAYIDAKPVSMEDVEREFKSLDSTYIRNTKTEEDALRSGRMKDDINNFYQHHEDGNFFHYRD